MNKTVTINISGIIFHIEEDAYDILSKYLATIKGYFNSTDGGNEIMSDIEARIAELLQEKINASKQVVLMSDVEHVINQMGKPEDFGGEQAQKEPENNFSQREYTHEKIKRRLFRNPDEKAIGGVCSGLAAYFDIDTVWVRLAMFLLVFFGGLSIWIYFILWIVIPESKTTADKLSMRGEAATISNIAQTFKEEAEDLKNRFNKNKGTYKRQFYDIADTIRNIFGYVLNIIFNITGRLIGLVFLMLGGLLLVVYIASLFGISIIDGDMQADNWKEVIFQSSSDYLLALIAFIIVFGIPIFMLIYGGVKLLFKIRYSNRWLNISMGIVWFIGLMLGVAVTVSTLNQFKHDAKLKELATLGNMGDTITIKLNSAANIINAKNLESDIPDHERGVHGGYRFAYTPNGKNILGYASLEIIETDADSVELTIYRIAKGQNKKEANENAQDVSYSYSQKNNELVFDEIFTVKQGSKFRAQDVNIKLKVPQGKVIYFDKSVKHFLDDAYNTTNTWEGDMINRRWKMTSNGLECIDCDNLNKHSKENNDISIDKHGIRIYDKSGDIEIDENGARVYDKNGEVKQTIRYKKELSDKKGSDEDDK